MSANRQLNDLPGALLSVRQDALEVLRDQCRQPTVDEWLDGLSRLTPLCSPLWPRRPSTKGVRQKTRPWWMSSAVL